MMTHNEEAWKEAHEGEWHDSPHEYPDPCEGCNPSTGGFSLNEEDLSLGGRIFPGEEAPDLKAEAKGTVEEVKTRIIGYHFAGLHLYPGKNGIRAVFFGDPGIPTKVSIKVVYTGTGHRNSIYTVPADAVVIEEEELPIAIVHGDFGVAT